MVGLANLHAMGIAPPKVELKDQSKPTPLILDEQGRTVDATGKEFKQQLKEKPSEDMESNTYFDPVSAAPAQRQRGLSGFTTRASLKNSPTAATAQLENSRQRSHKLPRRRNSHLDQIGPHHSQKGGERGDIPEVEWWDSYIIPNGMDVKATDLLKRRLFWHHELGGASAQLSPPVDSDLPVTLGVYLTKKSRRNSVARLAGKPRRSFRRKISNLMRSFGDRSCSGSNQSRSPCPSTDGKEAESSRGGKRCTKADGGTEESEKGEKLKEDISQGVTQQRNSKSANASQLYLTGVVVLHKDVNVVVVEGGPKAQKKFKRLMLHRIKWDEQTSNTKGDGTDEESVKNQQMFLGLGGHSKGAELRDEIQAVSYRKHGTGAF
ncbi:putative U4-U6 small nuclear ribonucleoprotein [Naja naja]|nr:putative U4-U6 small nuclear ribonucleoprotein [Naja naja]